MFPSTLANKFLSATGIAPILWSTDMCRLVRTFSCQQQHTFVFVMKVSVND